MSDEQGDDEQPKMHMGYSVEGAAQALGLRPVSVREAIREGRLRATMVGRQYIVSRQAVEQYRREHLGRKGWTKRRETEGGQHGGPRNDEPGR